MILDFGTILKNQDRHWYGRMNAQSRVLLSPQPGFADASPVSSWCLRLLSCLYSHKVSIRKSRFCNQTRPESFFVCGSRRKRMSPMFEVFRPRSTHTPFYPIRRSVGLGTSLLAVVLRQPAYHLACSTPDLLAPASTLGCGPCFSCSTPC